MKAIGVIPARWASTRLAGKVLADIAGKPMIQHVWERASQSRKLDKVIIACDEERIHQAAQSFGAEAVLTSKEHGSGTDRIAEVVASIDCDIVVNIQADEPLIQAGVIDELVEALENDTCSMATLIRDLKDPVHQEDPNVVKVSIDKNGYARQFSRKVIEEEKNYQHLGIYAYKKDFLLAFSNMPPSDNERREKLEQLRALDAGYKIKTVITDIQTISVDTQTDLDQVKEIIKDHG